jgi:histidyl-tRNA synthetase
MATKIHAVRGMNDILPADSVKWRQLEDDIVAILDLYGYREIRLPIVEQSEIFERSIGDSTDIVQKEMYSFADRNGDGLTLRPEGTAGCVRAALQHGLLQQLPQRLWYLGPMFRHERPQRGRHRQFHQFGVEAFGPPGPDIDAELILMTARMWRSVGVEDLSLELNSLGTTAARSAYRDALSDYFRSRSDELDEDSLNRLSRNPLRILDSKNPAMRPVIEEAPPLSLHLDDESRSHFEGLSDLLIRNDVEFRHNERLVRGLDYYSRTVFEWTTTELGAQGAVCAGGRYDGLIELIGGKPTPAVGFAIGIDRLIELMGARLTEHASPVSDLYVMATSEELEIHATSLAETLRTTFPHWRILSHVGGGSVKSRMKKADRSGALLAIIIGETEQAAGEVAVKPLRTDAAQRVLAQAALAEELPRLLTR